MTDVDAEGGVILQEQQPVHNVATIGAQPVDNLLPEAVLPSSTVKSASQALIDRFTEQTVRLQKIRQRLQAVLSVIDGRPKVTEAEPGTAQSRPTAFFEGMSLLAGCNDSVMEGLDEAVAELEALF